MSLYLHVAERLHAVGLDVNDFRQLQSAGFNYDDVYMQVKANYFGWVPLDIYDDTYTFAEPSAPATLFGDFTKPSLLVGTSVSDNLFGFAGDDALYGGLGDDDLYGGSGADSMYGGGGSDTYFVDEFGDLVFESLNSGDHDLVISSITYTLGANVEDLKLTDSGGNIDGTGDDAANAIFGNSGANTLRGGAGGDTLDGGARSG